MSTGHTSEIRPFRPVKRYRTETHPSHIFLWFWQVFKGKFSRDTCPLSFFLSRTLSAAPCLSSLGFSVLESVVALSRLLTLLCLSFSFPVSGLGFSLSAPCLPLFWIGNRNRREDSFFLFLFLSLFAFPFPSLCFSVLGFGALGPLAHVCCGSVTQRREWVFLFFLRMGMFVLLWRASWVCDSKYTYFLFFIFCWEWVCYMWVCDSLSLSLYIYIYIRYIK